MSELFEMDPRLGEHSSVVADLKLSRVLLVNDANFPWLILVPRVNKVSEIIDLSIEDQRILIEEIAHVSHIVKNLFNPDKLNVAALGNMVAQLHVHIIARFKDDIAWPAAAFGHERRVYSAERFEDILLMLQHAF